MIKTTVTPKEVKAYFDAWREVGKDKRLRGADWPILLVFRDSGWDEIFLTQEHIGERVAVNRTTANRSLKNIEACGYITGNHPPKGTKKPVTYKLIPKLTPPTKYIVFMYKSEDMNMYKSLYMKKKKIEPVMYKSQDTIDINGNKVNGLQKNREQPHGKQTMGNGENMAPRASYPKLPHTYVNLSEEDANMARKEIEAEHKVFDDATFTKVFRNFNDYCADTNKKPTQKYFKVFLRNEKQTKSSGIFYES